MSVAEQIMQKVAALPEDRQREVLAFVEKLEPPKSPLKDCYGILAGQIPDLSDEEWDQAREEFRQQFRNRLDRLSEEI